MNREVKLWLYLFFVAFVMWGVYGCGITPDIAPSQSLDVVAESIEKLEVDQTSNIDTKTTNNQMPPWMFIIVIFLAGWAIPSFSSCMSWAFGWLGVGLKILRKLF